MKFDVEFGEVQELKGEDGISPTVAVAEIEGGHRVTITDKDGAKSFDVMDGEDGTGSGGGSATALSKKQINALDALFKAASYTKDVSAEYAAFCVAFGLVNPDEPSDDVVVNEIKQGTVGFESGLMGLSAQRTDRATLVPIGRYLKKGKTYRFSLGNIATKYYYGVQIMVAASAGMEFTYVPDTNTDYSGVTERIIDTGWITVDYAYTPDVDNCILAVNFKSNPVAAMNDSNYTEILENFTFEETAPIAETTEPAYFIHKAISQLDDTSLALSRDENTRRIAVYSATMNTRCLAFHNGSFWDNSDYSPLKIPAGAMTAVVEVPSAMKYGAFIAKPHDTSRNLVMSVVDSGWITDGREIDVSEYNDGNHYFAANVAYISNAEIASDFDTSVLDVYFVDANGNRMP